MDNFWYLFAGLALAWATICFYLWTLSRRARDLKQKVEVLESQLGEDTAD